MIEYFIVFNSIFGKITGKFPQNLYLENSGIEWKFFVSDFTLDHCGNLGDEVRIFTYLYHKEDTMMLFGFSSETERQVFFDLIKVDGIGAKAAIKILSKIPPTSLVEILNSGDISALEAVPGVGKKTAQKMLLTLKGKLSLDDGSKSAGNKKSVLPDVSEALVSMGYDKKTVETVLQGIIETEEAKALSGKEKEDFVFRRAIIDLAR